MYDGSFPYRPVPCPRIYRLPDYFRDMGRLAREVTGDLVIAVKAYADTVPLAWWLRKRRGCLMGVYLDEWDGAIMAEYSRARRIKETLKHLHHPLHESYAPLVEKLIPGADLVLSTTTGLQSRFGGHVIRFGVDIEDFKPGDAAVRKAMRKKLGLEECRLIVFGGVARPHKGLELILEALALLGDPGSRLVIVGPRNEHVDRLMQSSRWVPYLVPLGEKPREEMPHYLDLADLVVLPLVDNLLARSQMPCKVFEAMAMAKPVIATAISDLPEIVAGCGWTVPPEDARALADAIRRAWSDAAELKDKGRAARAKCVREYSREAARQQLKGMLDSLGRRGVPDNVPG